MIIKIQKEDNKIEKIEGNSVEAFIYNVNTSNSFNEVNESKKIIKYDMVIEIPEINLKKGIYEKKSKNNDIDKNVMILDESNYPNEDGSIYIIAHSGTGKHSYFKNIEKLKMKSKVYLYYENVKYEYELINSFEVRKSKGISFATEQKGNLYLITCSQKNKGKYLILELIRK